MTKKYREPPEITKSFESAEKDLSYTGKRLDDPQVMFDAFRGPNHTRTLPKAGPLKYKQTDGRKSDDVRDPVSQKWIRRNRNYS